MFDGSLLKFLRIRKRLEPIKPCNMHAFVKLSVRQEKYYISFSRLCGLLVVDTLTFVRKIQVMHRDCAIIEVPIRGVARGGGEPPRAPG